MSAEARLYQRCTRTIMDTTDPDIWFDEHGVSSHAIRFDEDFAPVLVPAQRGELLGELEKLVDTIKAAGKGKPYDCVIGVSGGVDSTYLMLQAVRLGLRPLAVHFDSGWNSELAVGNIHNLVTTLGLDLHTHVIDWREMKDLQLSYFKASLANCDVPTDHAFGWVAYQQARKYGIKYILSGSNYATESILPEAWGYNSDDARHLKAVHARFGTVNLKTYPVMGMFKRHVWYPLVRRIETVRPLNYMPYVYTDAKQDIIDNVGWRDYGGKHYESVFTRYFQGYYLPHKFGFDKRLAHYSSLILSGQLTREEALSQMESSNYPESLREQDHEFIAKKLGITTAELEGLIVRPPVDYTAYPNSAAFWSAVRRLGAPVGRLARRTGLLK
ncbi:MULTISPECIES: N-acetyl sugar amidotransferase [unclassified Cryobacterium]|uniref:N-acetyl sugar amidotransferase n=1 Tax=unclassified Cryobacterium TaxID=2649013 RepID=UPI0014482AC7|nr:MULTISPECIES: N-acetyl sugar amidotransferase [unclassified Cryobacterium]